MFSENSKMTPLTFLVGGGSVLTVEAGLPKVGPESAGAHPGPVCYRHDNGILAVTDANLILGRIRVNHFPKIFGPQQNQSLDESGSREKFKELSDKLNKEQVCIPYEKRFAIVYECDMCPKI